MKIIVNQLINQVLRYSPHFEICFYIDQLPHPLALGFRPDIGEPRGQNADFRLLLTDGSSIHARDYGDYITYHWDKVDPSVEGLEHLRRDSPLIYTLLCTIGGAGVGAGLSLITNKKKDIKKNALKGGLLGLTFGVSTAEWE